MTNREISLKRAEALKQAIAPYLQEKQRFFTGQSPECTAQYNKNKSFLMEKLNADEKDWDNWHWQMRNRIADVDFLQELLDLPDAEKNHIEQVSQRYRWAITPYYASLIDPTDPEDPIKKMAVPSFEEMDEEGLLDPMGEEYTNPAGVITRRYPDRLILNVTNACAMFCRHCQRRRLIGEADSAHARKELDESIQYIRDNEEIRDVLITGGDPLTLGNDTLEYIIKNVRAIPHVEIIRLGTRTPVTMPQRIDSDFLNMIKKYHPIYLNTHFNHPKELTDQSIAACNQLADAGVPLGNQMVLLSGINDNRDTTRYLNQQLLKARVRPYYIFHPKQVKGTKHFQVSIDEGLSIMEYLRGYTSGMAIPTYIVNAPNGLGKIPLLPDYIVDKNEKEITLRTWEGKTVTYPNHSS